MEDNQNELAQNIIQADKEKELIRLLNVKTEKIVNQLLNEKYCTQLSYLSKAEQNGATALPKGMILDKMINFLKIL
jgi:hypothetical protein